MYRGWCALVAACAAIGSLVLASAAIADSGITWKAQLTRVDDASLDNEGLVLTAVADAPSYGVLFALNQDYTISDVTTTTELGAAPTACNPTPSSPLNHEPGIDCSFPAPVSQVTITFRAYRTLPGSPTTTFGYPGLGGGVIADDNDTIGALTPVGGPEGTTHSYTFHRRVDDIKAEAREQAYTRWSDAVTACGPDTGMFSGFFGGINHFYQRDCLANALSAYRDAIAEQDPPEDRYLSVAVAGIPAPVSFAAACGHLAATKRAICRTRARLATGLVGAEATLQSVGAAMYAALNRGSTADGRSSDSGVALQAAALAVIDGQYVQALRARDAAARALARALVAANVFPSATATQTAAEARALMAGKLPSGTAAGLRAAGVSAAQLSAALTTGYHTLTLGAQTAQTVLLSPSATGPSFTTLIADYHSLSLTEADALIGKLVGAHKTAARLESALAAAVKSHGAARAKSLRAYSSGLTKLPRATAAFLESAAAALVGGAAQV